MQNNINKDERDAFSDIFKQKLKNHEVPVDANSWDQINARLKSGKRRNIPFWLWLSGDAAVAALALLFVLSPFKESKDSIAKKIHPNTLQAPVQRKYIANNQHTKSVQKTVITSKPDQYKTKESSRFDVTVPLDFPPTVVPYHEPVDSGKTSVKGSCSNMNIKNNIAQNSTIKKDTVPKSNRYVPNSLIEEPVNEPIAITKNKNGWLIAASVGSNSNIVTASGNGNGLYAVSLGDKNIVSAATNYTSIMTPNDFQSISYTPPVSFGLVLRKNLTKSLSLESGLVYTYLLTTFENTGVQRNDARLHLHYIGVPLNLVARLWDLPKWEIYLSGGIMLEKGIKSVYVQNQYIGNQTITTTALTDINGFQWSVNGAAGTTYKIQRNIGIFFEPKISYYFDNNQPLSARTEDPIVIGLSAGVRFRLK